MKKFSAQKDKIAKIIFFSNTEEQNKSIIHFDNFQEDYEKDYILEQVI